MRKNLFFISFILFVSSSFAQNKLPKFRSGILINQYVAYNFFVGNDATKFKTSAKAFGSGIYDFSMVFSPYNYWISRPIKRNIGLLTTVAFDITKYRFENNLIFDTDNSTIIEDTISAHYYDADFFSYSGTKLVVFKLYIPLIVYFPISHWFKKGSESVGLFGGVVYRPYLFAYHKQLYEEKDRQVSIKTPNSLISRYFSKNDLTVKLGIKLKGIILFGQYTINNFFNSTMPYDLHEAKIGMNISFDFSSELKNIRNKTHINKEFGTDAR